jgi:hypothetical protein
MPNGSIIPGTLSQQRRQEASPRRHWQIRMMNHRGTHLGQSSPWTKPHVDGRHPIYRRCDEVAVDDAEAIDIDTAQDLALAQKTARETANKLV